MCSWLVCVSGDSIEIVMHWCGGSYGIAVIKLKWFICIHQRKYLLGPQENKSTRDAFVCEIRNIRGSYVLFLELFIIRG